MNAPTRPGVHTLQDMAPPKGWPKDKWTGFAADAFAFRRSWAQRAIDQGWTSLELFGVSRTHPYALHAWGAVLLIGGCKVVDITPDEIWVETGREVVDPETGEVTAGRLRISKRKATHGRIHAWDVN